MTAASNFDPQAKGAAAGDKSNPPEGTRPRSSEPEQAATPLSQAGNPAPEAADATADQPHAAERGVDIAASRQADPAAAHTQATSLPAPAGAEDEGLELPPIETIGPETSLAPWLRPGVPVALRNAALRRKWLVTPAIRDYVDPALDYAWDWNAPVPVPGGQGRVSEQMARKLYETFAPKGAPASAQTEHTSGSDSNTRAAREEAAQEPQSATAKAPSQARHPLSSVRLSDAKGEDAAQRSALPQPNRAAPEPATPQTSRAARPRHGSARPRLS